MTTHPKTHGYASDGAYDELQASLPHRERPGHHSSNRYPVGHDPGCVVQEALAFQDRHYAAGEAEALGHRGRCYGVGRGDYGPEDERRGPR